MFISIVSPLFSYFPSRTQKCKSCQVHYYISNLQTVKSDFIMCFGFTLRLVFTFYHHKKMLSFFFKKKKTSEVLLKFAIIFPTTVGRHRCYYVLNKCSLLEAEKYSVLGFLSHSSALSHGGRSYAQLNATHLLILYASCSCFVL